MFSIVLALLFFNNKSVKRFPTVFIVKVKIARRITWAKGCKSKKANIIFYEFDRSIKRQKLDFTLLEWDLFPVIYFSQYAYQSYKFQNSNLESFTNALTTSFDVRLKRKTFK